MKGVLSSIDGTYGKYCPRSAQKSLKANVSQANYT